MAGVWDGWSYDREEKDLFDDAGNHYYMDEIRALFYFRQWRNNFEGKENDILSLKEELKRRIENVPTLMHELWGACFEFWMLSKFTLNIQGVPPFVFYLMSTK